MRENTFTKGLRLIVFSSPIWAQSKGKHHLLDSPSWGSRISIKKKKNSTRAIHNNWPPLVGLKEKPPASEWQTHLGNNHPVLCVSLSAPACLSGVPGSCRPQTAYNYRLAPWTGTWKWQSTLRDRCLMWSSTSREGQEDWIRHSEQQVFMLALVLNFIF